MGKLNAESDGSTERSRTSTSTRTMISSGWLIGSRLATRALDLVGLLVLARILTPADFGIVAIGMTLVQLVEAITELPVSQVLVRSPSITSPLLSTAFTLSLIRGSVLAVGLLGLSLPFSLLFREPRLLGLISFLSLAPILRGFVSPRMVVFARAIDFRREVLLELVSKVSALLISSLAAYLTRSYWAIALGTVCTPLILVLGSYALAPFRPRVSLAEWPAFRSFLGWSTAAQAVTAINWQSDRPILGLFVSPSLLGTYSVANDLSLIPEQALVKPVYRPLLSGFVAVLNDRERLRQAHLKAAHMIVAVGTPALVGLALLATPATRLALGGKWLAAAPVVQWLALTLIIPLFPVALGPLAVALGRTRVFFNQSLVELCLRLPLTAFLAWRFGVAGLIISRLLTGIINTATSFFYVKRLVRLSYKAQLLVGWRPLSGGVAMAIVLLAARQGLKSLSGLWLATGLAGCAVVGILTYVGVNVGLWLVVGQPRTIEATILEAVRSSLLAPGGCRRIGSDTSPVEADGRD